MDLIVKKTSELSETEMHQICLLFKNVFNKEKSIEGFKQQFLNTCKGYSYHAFYMVDNEIVGINSIIPYEYNFFEVTKIFCLSVDTMVKKEYRSLPKFTKMTKSVYKLAKDDEVSLVFGFPNSVSYKIFKKMLRWRDIGTLDFYILPIRIGKLKKSFKVLNFMSLILSNLLNTFVSKIQQKIIIKYNIEKIANSNFEKQRYNNSHIIENCIDYKYIYKITNEGNAKVAYILDVLPFNKYFLEKSVQSIFSNHKDCLDGIIYIG